ncbi:FadR/GntR family transcriptional regulator [Secundilactobacillus similis]|uniref:FadR/GntR family transcriptional regulator n=1 Tax=Secundilactobacillus similis TaxID=414682 RepID=UPI0006CFCA48|nr:FCD domain-containing protein [Secundilactobacillus similis]
MKFEPIHAPSATDIFTNQMKEAIILRKLKPGETLPHERELAEQMGVSRSVINHGLQRLAQLHFITIKPRQGAVVADYLVDGTLETMHEVVALHDGFYTPAMLQSIYQVRRSLECDAIKLAAQKRLAEPLREARRALMRFKNGDNLDVQSPAIFDFFHSLAIASGNQVYTMMINSLKPIYLRLGRWNAQRDNGVATIFELNETLLTAVEAGQVAEAVAADERLIEWSLQDLMQA